MSIIYIYLYAMGNSSDKVKRLIVFDKEDNEYILKYLDKVGGTFQGFVTVAIKREVAMWQTAENFFNTRNQFKEKRKRQKP